MEDGDSNSGLVNIDELLDPALKPSPEGNGATNEGAVNISAARGLHLSSTTSQPAFINTDFTRPLLSQAATMDLSANSSQPGSYPGGAANIQPLTSVNVLAGGQMIGQPATAPGQVPQSPTLARTAFMPTVSAGQATLINVSPSLAGAAFFSQPIQVFSTGPYHQMVSTVPARFMAQPGTPTNLGGTVLMPLQQSLLQQPAALHRAQVITAPNFPKNIQPKPPNITTMPAPQPSMPQWAKLITNITTMPTGMVSVGTTMAGTAMPQVSNVSLPISLPTSQTHLQPRPAHMPGPQVLNIPRIPIRSPVTPEKVAPPTVLGSPVHHSATIQQHPLQIFHSAQLQPQNLSQNNLQPLQLTIQTSPAKQDMQQLEGTAVSQTHLNHRGNAAYQNTKDTSQKSTGVSKDTEPLSLATKKCSTDLNPTNPVKPQLKSVSQSSQGAKYIGHVESVKHEHLPSFNTPELPPIVPTEVPENEKGQRSIIDVRRERVKKKKHKEKEGEKKEVKKEEIKVEPPSEESHNVTIRYTEDKVPVEYDEPEFVWEEYLETTGATAAPPTSFKHVECSLQSSISKGMRVEVANKTCADTYWVASIVMTCGQLLRLRHEGFGDDSSADFWCDVCSSDIHSIGWCQQNGKNLHPPDGVKAKCENWEKLLITAIKSGQTAPSDVLDAKTGLTPIDQIKEGMRLEVQHQMAPQYVWLVRVMENIGGRLLLRYEGTDRAQNDFWLFYLHYRLHPIGWANENKHAYKPPHEIINSHSSEEWGRIQVAALKEAQSLPFPAHVFKDQIELLEHEFAVGHKLEAINPNNNTQICPASVVEVVNSTFFIVQLEDLSLREGQKGVSFCCHSGSPHIFPIDWCMYKGHKLTHPPGWDKQEFYWADYLRETSSEAAPDEAFTLMVEDHELERGMKLEAVNPDVPGQVCAATITRIIDHLMWIHLDGSPKMVPNHIVDVASHEIFPVGWCESNGYPLKPPRRATGLRNSGKPASHPEKAGPMTADEFRSATYTQIKTGDAGGSNSSWCPKIYFNHKCFSGPFLSKGRIAELPKCVGPGPITLVMKEVLSMLINVAYKSSRVLREIQMEGEKNPKMYQQVLKAKYKGKSYCATVEICKASDQIEDFCRQMCIKLECCPNLFSPLYVNDSCPENCSQLTKTKYTYYYGKKKKRKIGRPPGGHTNLEDGPKRPGKRRKGRKKVNLMGISRKKRESVDSDEEESPNEPKDEIEDDKSSVSSDRTITKEDTAAQNGEMDPDYQPLRKRRRRHKHLPPPPSIIKTRGAKLPKFTFERRTHKKIMIIKSPPKPPSPKPAKKPAVTTHNGEEILKLDTNPLLWSVSKVIQFIKTTDCAHLARIIRDQDIDGQALLLLSLPTVQEYMDLKLGPAIKLCHHIERVKIAFYEQYAN